jgi:hypothetical protein
MTPNFSLSNREQTILAVKLTHSVAILRTEF